MQLHAAGAAMRRGVHRPVFTHGGPWLLSRGVSSSVSLPSHPPPPRPPRRPSERRPRADRDPVPAPDVDGGRYPAKRCVGDTVAVEADIFRDGHELLRAVVRYRGPATRSGARARCERTDAHLGGVRWAVSFQVDRTGRWEYTIEAWTDVFGTWRDELRRKIEAGQRDLAGELSEGALLLAAAAENAGRQRRAGADRARAADAAKPDRAGERQARRRRSARSSHAAVERVQPSATGRRARRAAADRGRPAAGPLRRLV